MFDIPAVGTDAVSRQRRWLTITCSMLGHGLVAGVGMVILAPSAVWSFVEPPCAESATTRLTFRWPLPPAPSPLPPSVTARVQAAVVAAVPISIDEGDAVAAADDAGDGVAASMITPVIGGVCGCVYGGLTSGVAGASIGPITPVPPLVLPALPSRPLRAGDGAPVPIKIVEVRPTYPRLARDARIQGVVMLDATIDETGRVVDVRVLRSIAPLDDAAVDAVRQWRYAPAIVNGRPTAVVMTVTATFRL